MALLEPFALSPLLTLVRHTDNDIAVDCTPTDYIEREPQRLTVSLRQTEARCSVDRTNKAHAKWRVRDAAYA